ncbi:choline dehydrogenase [Mycolicibacterium insubricum]|jgi:choline dehydrogenase|uniref:Choline dehydrogenase n=1 Tax=Mycolicibacterium insubricum TaxID=444597 RepID=A0A1X0DFN8_9MYCO|nr:GMC family oxidoreductase N-terminal domain-containing protein [Mycolicibacterium insubricum]MCB9438809.1 GMC family oxidoreductase N-terminal domain-containing protein [Mycolicibacterium sp.]MCV7083337.1 GMC family oxidoreductase N-terminal domain-containing protein [Mycolicibacterium insubricum]ORA71185.1 choline dehydrogenase [Mycolicibacterium insubricum]BBZ68763.1 choline dehydrogenase [Mycolicibacterium insubricum]
MTKALSAEAQSADYVVVGAGSAGAIVARRLADSGAAVALIESGRRRRGPLMTVPGMCGAIHAVSALQRLVTWPAHTVPQRQMNGRMLPQSHGRVLGGGSVINGMAFVRGNRHNFDGWAADGATGWAYGDVLASFRRLESFEDGASELRGGHGPIAVERATGLAEVTERYMDALAATAGIGRNPDYNGADQAGVAPIQQSVGRGRRAGTDRGYLDDAPANLRVITGATATRVVISGGRAVGVELVAGRDRRPIGTVRASREVIVSSGSLGSPRLLMLSGIGPAEHLREHGIDVVADLPVGDNLHDHLFVPLSYHAPNGRSASPLSFGRAAGREILRPRSTYLAHTLFEGVAFLDAGGRGRTEVPDLQMFILPMSYPENQDEPGLHLAADSARSLTMLPTMIYPQSRGTVRLASTDPFTAPLIDPNYLAEPQDLATLVAGMELVRESLAHPAISGEVGREVLPGADLHGEDLAEFARRNASGVYHPVGTCRMGSDERAVVDPALRVRGVSGLRVADAAVMPSIVGGNTNAAAMMIGERAAELILGG